MAKIEGDQNIPSELWKKYRAFLTLKTEKGTIRARCPFERPRSRAGGPDETDAQREQRSRWLEGVERFNTLDYESRSRWYETRPEWHSYLWYYNWFMLSALMGITGVPGKGEAVIRSIQNVLVTIPEGGGTGTGTFSSINPTRAVVLLNGNSLAIDNEGGVFWASLVYPYVVEIGSTWVKLKWSIATPYTQPTKQAVVSAMIIEYI